MKLQLLIVYAGPVHAEKTTAALHHADRMARLGRSVRLIRPTRSIRTDPEDPARGDRPGTLVTKRGESWPATELELAAGLADEFAARPADELWLDEPGLWPDNELVFPAVQRIRQHVPVTVSTIVASSEGDPFQHAPPALWAAADRPIQLLADCDVCGRSDSATRSAYIGNVPKVGQIKVGGCSDYVALCPACDVTDYYPRA